MKVIDINSTSLTFLCFSSSNLKKTQKFRDIRKVYGKDWGRPSGDFSGDLSFQQIDLDKVVDYNHGEDPRPVIRIFGSDKNGSSVACFVQNFRPYFYVPARVVKITCNRYWSEWEIYASAMTS